MREERRETVDALRARAREVGRRAREAAARMPRDVEDVEGACASAEDAREAFARTREAVREAIEREREEHARSVRVMGDRTRDVEEVIDRIIETRVGVRR
jgi:hypothetical protein